MLGALTWSQPDESLMGPSARPWVPPGEGLPTGTYIPMVFLPLPLQALRPPQDDGVVGSIAVESTFVGRACDPCPPALTAKLYTGRNEIKRAWELG